jgi:23S rRNA (guanine745-N1)-methyltransferase
VSGFNRTVRRGWRAIAARDRATIQGIVPRLPLACSVRHCSLPLERGDRTFVCPAGHSYDIARSGYVNLLQPHDRRSSSPGDSKAAVEARAALLGAGVGHALVDAVARGAATLDLGEGAVVVDLGSGSGHGLAALVNHSGPVVSDRPERHIAGIGIDLSTAAAEYAARRFPTLTWVVANADRRLPLLDRGVDLVFSLHGRRNPAECARVLRPAGFLMVALPAPDDLAELRTFVQGRLIERDRGEAMLAEHQERFSLIERSSVRQTAELDRDSLVNLLRGTYRGERLKTADRVKALDRLQVTLSSELFLFTPRRTI